MWKVGEGRERREERRDVDGVGRLTLGPGQLNIRPLTGSREKYDFRAGSAQLYTFSLMSFTFSLLRFQTVILFGSL
jgi:hypothetical protein